MIATISFKEILEHAVIYQAHVGGKNIIVATGNT